MKWEYKVVGHRAQWGPVADKLNELGAEGWELVSAETQVNHVKDGSNHGHGYRDESTYVFIFKRMLVG